MAREKAFFVREAGAAARAARAAFAAGVTAGLFALPAAADPTGAFSVEGKNADGSVYSGVAEVRRAGETYQVVWTIAGDRFDGTGLGAKVVDGTFLVGPADPGDTALAVGYISGPSAFGMAMYFQQPDGSWSGVWTYGGSDEVATEVWRPR